MQTFIDAYIECALWSSIGENDEPLDDNYGPEDIAPETLKTMRADCEDFQVLCGDLIDSADMEESQAGHDFWLTRNGHGAGFWDRGLGDVGEKLSEAAKVYGEFYLYIGDDGRIHGQ